jgi:hypothetical protein
MVDKLWYVVIENVDSLVDDKQGYLPLAGPYNTRDEADAVSKEVINRFKGTFDRFWFSDCGVASTYKLCENVVYPEYTKKESDNA